MMRSLYSGVSGLRTHQTKMDVIGNNIANVNTVAFKSSSVTFSDILYQTTSGASGPTQNLGGKNPNQIGLGVMAGSTKVSIENGGSEQTTGERFDIRLSDSNSTNFFIVNNGASNLFTRAGSFFTDANGNLAMTSTGYMVMGWGVDPDHPDQIRKDTVQPLRILQPSNMTTDPESTTEAIATGIVDKNSEDLNSETGIVMNLAFYDQEGYAYTAKFNVHAVDTKEGKYNVELADILDANNNSILDQYVANVKSKDTTLADDKAARTKALENLWGKPTKTPKTYGVTNASAYKFDGSKITRAEDGATATLDSLGGTKGALTVTFTKTDGTTEAVPLTTIFANIPSDVYANAEPASAASGTQGAASGNTSLTTDSKGNLVVKIEADATAYDLKFNPTDGSFSFIGEAGSNAQPLNLTALNTMYESGGPFSNVNFDFTGAKNIDNGGTSSLTADRGDTKGTEGLGKKIGHMTDVSVANSGKIYASYDNGNTVLLGQIAVAQFANASGLEANGDNCYSETLNSGEFDGIGVEVTADGGSMVSGALEMSNVDLSKEFTEMITTQRGFQANSRIITVSDTMLEELVNLKR